MQPVLTTLVFVLLARAQNPQTQAIPQKFFGPLRGANPEAPVILDAAGNLYGTTYAGGLANLGTVYKIDSAGRQTVLHSFRGSDGKYPSSGLIGDAAGNLYGTTEIGGAFSQGTVYKIDPSGQETVLHSFRETEGTVPVGGVVLDAAGNFYGATSFDGEYGAGTVYKLDPAGQVTVLHNFSGRLIPHSPDGEGPEAGVIRDSAGNLYGTTLNGGGLFDFGSVYKIDASGQETLLHSFTGLFRPDGEHPNGGVIRGPAGNLYGTTAGGGSSDDGTVYRIDPSGHETVLHNFTGGADGLAPYGELLLDAAGNLYGTTGGGGAFNYGTVYMIDPTGSETVLHSFVGADGIAPPRGSDPRCLRQPIRNHGIWRRI